MTKAEKMLLVAIARGMKFMLNDLVKDTNELQVDLLSALISMKKEDLDAE